MRTDEVPEKVDKIEVVFLAPDAGWSRLTIRTTRQELSWPLSHVYDPFYEDFTAWLEATVENGTGTISIDSEGNVAKIEVMDSANGTVRVFGESIYEKRNDLLIEMPRRQFVSDFYSSLVAFWESDELKQNWDEWSYALKRPDWREDYPPEIQKVIEQPWPIRSAKVESYLATSR
jgi:hypothetical protein